LDARVRTPDSAWAGEAGVGKPSVESRPAALKRLLTQPDLAFLMEAHNGLSAKIVEEAGFEGVWASGLSISASLGVRDNNEASWTQTLEVLEFMADATSLPILVDGDTGYGNFNNVRRLVRKLEQRGIAGVCIEDKLFPKMNSFLGEGQDLADMTEFCGRLRAGADSKTDADFCIVARTEALISGLGLDEALRRAEAYHAAGADAVLIHSKQKTAAEILAFLERWDGRCPVVVVPTTYHATPTEIFRQAGVSTVIWANHIMRAAVTAMRETAERIQRDESLHAIEGAVVPVSEIFRITGNDEYEEASRIYLPPERLVRGIVLAASRGGEQLREITEDKPKAMVDVRGRPLLRRLVDTMISCGARDMTVVRGWKKETIAFADLRYVDNDAWATTGEVASLAQAAKKLEGECVVTYGDVLFRRWILDGLLEVPGDVAIAVDALWERGRKSSGPRDLVRASRAFHGFDLDEQPATMTAIGSDIEAPTGEWIGLMKLSARGSELVRDELKALADDGLLATADLPLLLTRLQRHTPVAVHYVTANWLDVDDVLDLADARNFPFTG
jgi:phosphoenolpyruvate phosphomutase